MIVWAALGLIVGSLAGYLVPGRAAAGVFGAVAAGVVGGLAGGWGFAQLRGGDGAWLGALAAATATTVAFVAFHHRRWA